MLSLIQFVKGVRVLYVNFMKNIIHVLQGFDVIQVYSECNIENFQ